MIISSGGEDTGGMIFEETTRVHASPEAIYSFFETMDANYERWHPDHIEFRWVEGETLTEGTKSLIRGIRCGKDTAKDRAVHDGRPRPIHRIHADITARRTTHAGS
jgi:hypothetical protein